jgi:predicted transcriptional regulator
MKTPSTIRFSYGAKKILARLTRKLGVSQSAIIEMAIRQFDETSRAKSK